MKICLFALVALCLCSAYGGVSKPAMKGQPSPQCKAPNGGGLQSVVEEFIAIIPIDDVLAVYANAVSVDAEVQKAMAYLETESFHSLLKAVQSAPDFYKLMNFACEKLYLDMYYYFNLVGDFLGLPPLHRPLMATTARKGLMGMVQDIIDILPMEKLKALYNEKITNDEYAKKGLELLSSKDFKNIVKTLEGLKEYKELTNELRKVGVDVDTIIAAIKKYFKWD